jgi:hypothetical protein
MSGALKRMFGSPFLQIGGALSDDGAAGDGSDGEGRRAARSTCWCTVATTPRELSAR